MWIITAAVSNMGHLTFRVNVYMNIYIYICTISETISRLHTDIYIYIHVQGIYYDIMGSYILATLFLFGLSKNGDANMCPRQIGISVVD